MCIVILILTGGIVVLMGGGAGGGGAFVTKIVRACALLHEHILRKKLSRIKRGEGDKKKCTF